MDRLLTVLIVESDREVGSRIRAMLSGVAQTAWVHSLNAVRNLDRCLRFDCIVADPDLVDSFGASTLMGIRECFPKPPLVVLNGHFSRENAKTAVACGADCYFTKEDIQPPLMQHAVEFLAIKNENNNKETRASISSLHRIAEEIKAL